MTLSGPLSGVRVVEYAQYVAGPLCGVLLADLGAEVVKVEPPGGDGYRHVLPVAPGIGRYFVSLNRGKRSVVLDLKTAEGRAASGRLAVGADVVLHNSPPDRARAFGLDWDTLHAAAPSVVAGVVTSFGDSGPLAGAPAYDLIAQARSGLLTSHASAGDRVPVRAGGIPMADLTAGFLLSSAVLAALLHARETGAGEVVSVSLLDAALAVQLEDLVWLEGEAAETDRAADRRRAAPRGACGRDRGRRGDESVLPLLRRRRRLRRGRVPQREATARAPRPLRPRRRDRRGSRPRPGRSGRSRSQGRADLGDRAEDRTESCGALAGDARSRRGAVRPGPRARDGPRGPAGRRLGARGGGGAAALGTVRLLASVLGGGKTRPALPAPELGADTEAVLGALP